MNIRGFKTKDGVKRVDYDYVENKPIQRMEGVASENVILRDLESGAYVLSGQFRPFSGSTQIAMFDGEMIAAVNRQTDKSFVQLLSPANNAIQHMEITDSTCTVRTVKLSETSGAGGVDGITPHIGENGNWFLGDVDTGVAAQGPQGKPGTDGKDGKDGSDASVTAASIKSALGYTPADAAAVSQLSEDIGDIDTALDAIIAMQESYIGGEGA